METINLTTERLVALGVIVAQVVVAALFSTVFSSRATSAAAAFALCIPGLVIIWFREGLSFTGFDRGVLRESPPLMLDLLGWLFLVALPVIFLYGLLL